MKTVSKVIESITGDWQRTASKKGSSQQTPAKRVARYFTGRGVLSESIGYTRLGPMSSNAALEHMERQAGEEAY